MKITRKPGWYLIGVLVIALALVVLSCGGAAPAETQTPAQQTPAVEQGTPQPETKVEETTSAAIPNIPADHEGRTDCLMCHKTGGLKPFPADHEGRTNESCNGCHQSS